VDLDLKRLEALVDAGTIGNPSLTPEENKRLVRSLYEHSFTTFGPQLFDWAKSTAYHVRRLATAGQQASVSEFSMFWLRLYGLLKEAREDCQGKLTLFEAFFEGKPIPSEDQRNLEVLRPLAAALDKALALFAVDELLYIRYRRDSEAHVWQDAYRLTLKRNKRLREVHSAFDTDWKIEELNGRIESLRQRYG